MQTQVEIKVPKNFNDFRLIKKNYLIRSNAEICQSIPFVSVNVFNRITNKFKHVINRN